MYLQFLKGRKEQILSCYSQQSNEQIFEKGKESSQVADMLIPDDPKAAEKYKEAYDAFMNKERKKCKEEGREFDLELNHGNANNAAMEAAVK